MPYIEFEVCVWARVYICVGGLLKNAFASKSVAFFLNVKFHQCRKPIDFLRLSLFSDIFHCKKHKHTHTHIYTFVFLCGITRTHNVGGKLMRFGYIILCEKLYM